MKALTRFLAATLLIAPGFTSLCAQSFNWKHLDGPQGGSVRSIARTPDGTLFATVDAQGLYRSKTGGATWVRTPLAANGTWSAMIHSTRNGTLLLSTPDSLLQRSTDGGATWSTPLSGLIYWSTELVEDSSGGTIAAGLHDLFRSTDNGATWFKQGSKLDDEISAMTVGADGRLVLAVERSFSPRGIAYSTDLGANWTQVQIGDSNTPTTLALAATPDGRLYAGTGGGGIFRSDDGGATWNDISIQKSFYYSAFAVPSDGSIVVASSRGIYRTTDRGANWQLVGNPDDRLTIASLALSHDDKILVGTFGSGVYARIGNNWMPSSLGLPRVGVTRLAVAPDQALYTITAQGRLFRSDDGGTSWAEPDYSRFFPSAMAVGANGTLFAANTFGEPSGVIHSTDRGATWNPLTSGMEDEIVLALQPGRHGEIYAGVERGSNTFHQSLTDGLFRSTDDGVTWTTIGKGLTETSPKSIVELSDGTLLVGSEYGKLVLRLLPGDSLWQDLSTGLPIRNNIVPLYALIADRAENLYAGTQKGLYKSTNRGNNWQRIGTEIADTSITALAMAPGGRLYAATILHGVYASDDNGATWRYLGDAPGATGFDALAVDSAGILTAGSAYAGIYRASEVLSVPMAGSASASSLAIYPNPVGARATMEFTMATTGNARLSLYSATGNRLAVIANASMAQGVHRIELDLSAYAPGAYHIQLETARGLEQIGIIIVR